MSYWAEDKQRSGAGWDRWSKMEKGWLLEFYSLLSYIDISFLAFDIGDGRMKLN